MNRRAEIDYVNRSLALVRGYGTREALMELKHGRPPVWSRQNRAWTCQPKTAVALTALLERAGYEVTLSGAVPTRSSSSGSSHERTTLEEDTAQAGDQSANEVVGLW